MSDAAPYVLIVDDEVDHREVIRDALTQHFQVVEVAEADGADAALGELRERPITTVVLDYRLPGRDGLDLLPELLETRPGVVVIVTTARGSEDTAVAALHAGAADYVPKHADLATRLPAAVERAMQLQQLRAAKERAEREREALQRFADTTLQALPLAVVVVDRDLNVHLMNAGAERLALPEARDPATGGWRYPVEVLADHDLAQLVRDVADGVGPVHLADVHYRPHGAGPNEVRHIALSLHRFTAPEPDGTEAVRVVTLAQDVTEQHLLEEQVRQSAKLEAIGQLAGGVAHDFNNLLTGISGFAQIVRDGLPEGSPQIEDLQQVVDLSDKAAGLTRQLLAFGRKQALQPQVLTLNDVVADLTKMLHRVIDEHVDLVFVPAADLGVTLADPGQIEQVVMNLAVNARDAMPDGGHLTIETQNVTLDEAYAGAHLEVSAGEYVLLAISDTGHGMDAETLSHIFEPFYTTKGVGQGTGLGLATVYGIVKQHGGHISVYSELGSGTTFKVYLPRTEVPAEAHQAAPEATQGGSETILVVEDDETVRKLAERILTHFGYTVLAVGDPRDAGGVLEAHDGHVSLLLTDVVMPGMNGRELYDQLALSHPRLRVLYASGYTDNAIVHRGVLDPGIPFISKPFTLAQLARKVREVLDGR
jgi:signal transduction histidine kinase